MSKDFEDDVIQEINANADLVEIAEDFVRLYKRGSNEYFCCCPLHVDKTPSLTISNNNFYCFSCGTGGRVFGFLTKICKMTREEAIQYGMNILGIDVSKMCKSETIKYLKSVKRQTRIVDGEKFVHPILPKYAIEKYSREPVLEWEKEGIKPEIIDLFGVRIDNYTNRIVYPVYDLDGNLINVKGRTRYKEYKLLGLTKYMNYNKIGVMDYFQCLNVTLPYIKEKNEVIIFESIKSVMKAYGWGYKNCVSAEKHVLTDEQILLLVQLKVNVVFAYDSDVDYNCTAVKKDIDKLRMITNVFVIMDDDGVLGGEKGKNAPVDLGEDIWENLYKERRKVT